MSVPTEGVGVGGGAVGGWHGRLVLRRRRLRRAAGRRRAQVPPRSAAALREYIVHIHVYAILSNSLLNMIWIYIL